MLANKWYRYSLCRDLQNVTLKIESPLYDITQVVYYAIPGSAALMVDRGHMDVVGWEIEVCHLQLLHSSHVRAPCRLGR